MNKSDSERLSSLFDYLDLCETDDYQNADIIILNTCSVRQSAEDRVFGILNNLLKIKKEKDIYIGIIGCVPGRDKDKTLIKNINVDFYAPNRNINELIKDIMQKFDIKKEIVSKDEYMDYIPKYTSKYEAFVPIMNGCNMQCSYCIVPISRGGEIYRNTANIINEIKQLVSNGYKEICLLGQNVNSYKFDESFLSADNPYKNGFARLLYEIYKVSFFDKDLNMYLPRIHFTSPHPANFVDDVIDALTLPNIMKYVHIPLQSGSNKILKLMKRSYNVDIYLKIIEKIKNKIPDIAIATDIIVGFPGETEEDFMQTVELYKKIEFDISYHAKYSPRPNTFAYSLNDDVSDIEKERRWKYLQNLMEEITYKKNQKLINKNSQILLTSQKNNYFIGHNENMKVVYADKDNYKNNCIGDIVVSSIKKAETWRLFI